MTTSTIETIETLLESVLDLTEDSAVHFKLGTALSLLLVVKERDDVAREVLEDAELDEEVRRNLVELGYLDCVRLTRLHARSDWYRADRSHRAGFPRTYRRNSI